MKLGAENEKKEAINVVLGEIDMGYQRLIIPVTVPGTVFRNPNSDSIVTGARTSEKDEGSGIGVAVPVIVPVTP